MIVFSATHNEKKNASPKAPGDINKILEDAYNAKIYTTVRTGNYKIKLLLRFFALVFSKDIIVIQHPLITKSFIYKFLPKKRTIILIHDISGLRNSKEELLMQELKIFKMFDYIIVHNEKMKSYLISKGISKEKIYLLELFDYLAKGSLKEKYKFNESKIKLIYPGNLKEEKSPFIYQLDQNKMNFTINLYGIGINENINDKLVYKGSFEPDEINDLIGDIGLIWDGNYDESDEKLSFKNYTKYNNPHKLSCCMALGIPVIVWKKSAIASFVQKNNIGYLINNIYDINKIDLNDYREKRKNAQVIGKKVRDGYYTKRVINEILSKLSK